MAKKITLKNKAGEVLCPHTAIEQVQGLKDALDGKLGKTEKAASATNADSATTLGASSYWEEDLNTFVPAVGKVGYYSIIPNTATNIPDFAGYQNSVMSFGLHDNGATAQMFFAKDKPLYYRSSQTGEWKQLRTINDLVTTSHIATAAITPAKIQTSIALNGTPSMTVEPTTSSPDKTIASVGMVKEAVEDLEIDTRNLIPNSERIYTGVANSNVYRIIVFLPTMSIKVGDTFTFNCDKIEDNQGSSEEYTLLMYDFSTESIVCNQVNINKTNRQVTLVAIKNIENSSNISLFIYAGQNGATTGNAVTYTNCTLVRGDKPMLMWQAAPEDVEAKIEAVKPTIFLQTLQPSATEVKEGDIWIIQ